MSTNPVPPQPGNYDGQTPPGPPADPWGTRIALGAVGLGLVAFLIGAALIADGGKPVPTQYWSTGSAISGALIGILAPTPSRLSEPTAPKKPSRVRTILSEVAALLKDLWKNRQLFILTFVFVVTAVVAVTQSSVPMETVAAAAGGALIGLLAPSPSASTS